MGRTLGQITKEYRTKHNLSVRRFATQAKITPGYLSFLEQGKHPKTGKEISPSFETISNVAEAMGADIFSVMHEIGIECDPHKAVESGAMPPPSLSGGARIEPFEHIPLTKDNLNAALQEHRILITQYPVPRKGSQLFAPNVDFDMVVMYEVSEVYGGVYVARAEIGVVEFTIFDIGRIIFTDRHEAKKALEAIRAEKKAKSLNQGGMYAQ